MRDMTGPAGEVPLVGGTANRGLVVRVGDTVRRPRRETTPATHPPVHHLPAPGLTGGAHPRSAPPPAPRALLRPRADPGFPGAPRALGVDEQGREVLSYVAGTAVTPPYPSWALTDDALDSVAHLLREYHAAVSTFDPAGHV